MCLLFQINGRFHILRSYRNYADNSQRQVFIMDTFLNMTKYRISLKKTWAWSSYFLLISATLHSWIIKKALSYIALF